MAVITINSFNVQIVKYYTNLYSTRLSTRKRVKIEMLANDIVHAIKILINNEINDTLVQSTCIIDAKLLHQSVAKLQDPNQ